jgi:hypothetical protein
MLRDAALFEHLYVRDREAKTIEHVESDGWGRYGLIGHRHVQ